MKRVPNPSAAALPARRPRGSRGGMTLIELSIGLVLTSMVVAALGGVWYAVARTWEQTSGLQATTLTASHAVGRLELTLRESKYVLQYRRGALKNTDPSATAMALLWR